MKNTIMNKTHTEFYSKKWNPGETVFKNQQIDPPMPKKETTTVVCRQETINGKNCLIIPSQL